MLANIAYWCKFEVIIEGDYPTQIPVRFHRKVAFHPITAEQCIDTYAFLGDDPEMRSALGSVGLQLATQIRMFNFGNVTDRSGNAIENRKLCSIWLICEAACLADDIVRLAEVSAINN